MTLSTLNLPLSDKLETSPAILQAIRELVGEDEAAIIREWQDPTDDAAIIRRAREIEPDEPLYWGASGRVA